MSSMPAPCMPDQSVTTILEELAAGDPTAEGRLWPLVYDHLRALAARCLRPEEPVVQPTDVVHEAYLRLVDQTRVSWRSRSHFHSVAAQIMRRILVDWARARRRLKRGGEARRVPMADLRATPPCPLAILDLEDALEELAAENERWARVVEMRFFAGLELAEIATALGVSLRTVERDWQFTRSWLHRRLGG